MSRKASALSQRLLLSDSASAIGLPRPVVQWHRGSHRAVQLSRSPLHGPPPHLMCVTLWSFGLRAFQVLVCLPVFLVSCLGIR